MSLAHLGQQFLAKGLASQTPTRQHRLELLLGGAPEFNPLLELSSSGRTVLENPVFSQQPVHPQPAKPL